MADHTVKAFDEDITRLRGLIAEMGGLVPFDVVRFVDQQPVSGLDDFRALFEERVASGAKRIMLQVRRRDATRFVLLKLSPERGEGS